MNINDKNNNITVHDFSQRLNYYSKSNIFSGYLIEQNKSINYRYKNNSNNIPGNNNTYISKQKQYNSLLNSQPKYLFPSMDNNLLCENLFQRKTQKLPRIKGRGGEIFRNQSKSDLKNNNYYYLLEKVSSIGKTGKN